MYSVKDKNGKDLDKSLYKIDFEKKTFSSREHYLVIDFSGLDGWFFDTLSNCEFETGNNCEFETGNNCEFKTDNHCSFDTYHCCKFKTGNNCKFVTLAGCKFLTGNNCSFDTRNYCKFKTGNNCSFDTSYFCIFETGNNCELKCYSKKYKLSKGFSFVNDEYKLHTDIDENWALLNTKHDDEYIRDVCKFILKGYNDV